MALVSTGGLLWTVGSWLLVLTLSVAVLLVLLTLAVKVWATGSARFCHSKARLDGKTVLITGGNAGIGKETAVDLAGRGARVILGCRNKGRAEAAVKEIKERSGNENVLFHLLDLSDLDSVRSFAEIITQTEKQLDILINNAGVGRSALSVLGNKTKQGYHMVFGTNYLGPFLLTYLLLDLLEKSAPSHVINVSSLMNKVVRKKLDLTPTEKDGIKFPGLNGYDISKLANIMHARELAKRLKDKNVRANSLHPGFVDTEIWTPLKKRVPGFIYNAYRAFLRVSSLNSQAGAQTTIFLAVDEEAQSENGSYFSNCEKAPENKLALDDAACAQLWDVSMKMCDLK